ncbi:MAG: hypothetical protein ABFS18_06740 [Thermodesulfobacteriota bacterium]
MIRGFNKLLLLSGLFMLAALIFVGNATAADFVMILKSGTVQLADDTQKLDLETRDFDKSSAKTLAIAWEVRNSRDVGMGMEYITFEHDFTSPSSDGYAKTQLYLFSARKYFNMGSMVHPFGGVGLGWGYSKFGRDGDVDRDLNYVLQINAGLEIQLAEEFGIFIEGKALASGTDGERENEFDFSGPSLMAGVSLIF